MRHASMLWGNVKRELGKFLTKVFVGGSLTGTGTEADPIELDGDEESPEPNYYYGTDEDGEKGYHELISLKGEDGKDGEDGTSVYTYVAYAGDNAGTGWSLTPTDELKYRAEIHSTTELTPVESDFSGAIWVKYIGDDGEDGGGGGSIIQHQGITISSSGWTSSSYGWKYEISDILLNETDTVRIIPYKDSNDIASEAKIFPELEVENGIITIWAKNKPEDDIKVFVDVIGELTVIPPPVEAVGGDNVFVSDIGGIDYKFHVFTTLGDSTLTATTPGEANVLIVAGGGGGGRLGGGGGGGEVKLLSVELIEGSNTIFVGDGGNGSTTTSAKGANGENSVFNSYIALGGGGGGSNKTVDGADGGNGGGGGCSSTGGIGGTGIFNGGAGLNSNKYGCGGGAGAGGHGYDALSTGGGNGGESIDLSSIFGTTVGENGTFAGGGGGGEYKGSTIAGVGGGGGAGNGSGTVNGEDGMANTGGGGGGTTNNKNGGKGGSGIVIVYYKL